MAWKFTGPGILPKRGFLTEMEAKRAAVRFAAGHEPEDDTTVEQLFRTLARQGWDVEIEL